MDENLFEFIQLVTLILDIKPDEYEIHVDENHELEDGVLAGVPVYPGMEKGELLISNTLYNPTTQNQRLALYLAVAEQFAFLWEGLRYYSFYFDCLDSIDSEEEMEEQPCKIDAAAIALLIFEFFFEKHPARAFWHPRTYEIIVKRAEEMSADFDARVEFLFSQN